MNAVTFRLACGCGDSWVDLRLSVPPGSDRARIFGIVAAEGITREGYWVDRSERVTLPEPDDATALPFTFHNAHGRTLFSCDRCGHAPLTARTFKLERALRLLCGVERREASFAEIEALLADPRVR